MSWKVDHGDCLEVLRTLPDDSVYSCVTDPPYGLNFMSKTWDSEDGVQIRVELWSELLRVLKPGAHMIVFGGARTHHRVACAIEDAGFEIRDCLMWLYGSGFPKNLDVSKTIDKKLGAEHLCEFVCENPAKRPYNYTKGETSTNCQSPPRADKTATDDAKRWQGWGTALKPAYEPVVLARKPPSGTVVETVLEHETGAINIDACRVETDWETDPNKRGLGYGHLNRDYENDSMFGLKSREQDTSKGRWPPNVLLSPEEDTTDEESPYRYFPRFCYTKKASRKERNEGLETSRNDHPTVKPLALMQWLVRLVTPPGGLVLDPFTGSGSTGVACVLQGFDFHGIEREEPYVKIARERIGAQGPPEPSDESPEEEPDPFSLFLDDDL